jgi:hypothetical protein
MSSAERAVEIATLVCQAGVMAGVEATEAVLLPASDHRQLCSMVATELYKKQQDELLIDWLLRLGNLEEPRAAIHQALYYLWASTEASLQPDHLPRVFKVCEDLAEALPDDSELQQPIRAIRLEVDRQYRLLEKHTAELKEAGLYRRLKRG